MKAAWAPSGARAGVFGLGRRREPSRSCCDNIEHVRKTAARFVCLALVSAGATLFPPRTVLACVPPIECPYLVPDADVEVPANTPGFFASGCRGSAGCDREDPPILLGPGGPVPAAIEEVDRGWILRPASPLEPGTRYELVSHVDDVCSSGGSVFITAGPPAPLPVKLGTLRIVEQGIGEVHPWTSSGSCTSTERGAYARVELDLDPAALPFRPVLQVGWAPAGPGDLFSVCGEPQDPGAGRGLPQGTFTVRASGALVGGAPLEAASTKVTLSCQPAQAAPEGGCSAGGGGGWMGLLVASVWAARGRVTACATCRRRPRRPRCW